MNPSRNLSAPSIPRPFRALPAAAVAALLAATLLCLIPPAARAADKKAPPAKPAAEYAASDTHPDEHVTIAADPCDDPKLCPFFRLPYIQHGLLPVRVVITNDSDHAISPDDARMQFISANNDQIPPATEDDTIRHAPGDKKITDDDNDFGFKSTTGQPHSTVAGYLFYDIKDLDDPALKGAEFYVKMVHTVDSKQELFAFTDR